MLTSREFAALIGAGYDLPAADLVGVEESPPPSPALLNVPNAITLAGYAAGLYWVSGGGPGWALASIVADEIDGHVARGLGQTSAVGADLDFGVDCCMLALIASKAGAWYLAPVSLFASVALRQNGFVPPFGSARAVAMLFCLARGEV